MKMIYKIARAELQTLFYSPVAWLILIIFTVQVSLTFTRLFGYYVSNQELGYAFQGMTLGTFSGMFGLFATVQKYLYLYIPLLTMGLMSREIGSGSIKQLYAAPITNSHIILGKYLSMMIFGFLMIVILLLFAVYALFTIKSADFTAILTGLLGLYMLICAYSAVGLFMSSLTSYQVVAAIGTLAVLSSLSYMKNLWQDIPLVRDITWWFSIEGRCEEFVNGLICTEDIFYFLIVIALFLSLSVLRLNSVRQKVGFAKVVGKYAGVVVVAMLLGYVTSRPQFMAFYDATRTKLRTLTMNSQDIVRQMKGGLTITTYANILDDNFYLANPRFVKSDYNQFRQYTRFKPEIKMKYVYYYGPIDNPGMDKRYPNLSLREKMVKTAAANGLDSTMFISYQDLPEGVDLAPEGYRFVRLLERQSGERTFLRLFDDMMRYPGETEISAAFKRLVMELPVVGFVKGHGERDCIREGDRDYNRFTQDKPFRYSLINQGFDFEEVTLDREIPPHIRVLVIADMRTPMDRVEQLRLDEYLERGGNLLIAGEPGREEVMNPLVERFGVRFMPGRLVKNSENYQADFIISKPTAVAREFSYIYESMILREQVVTMPGCTGLSYSEINGYTVLPLFASDSTGSWNEVETLDFIDGSVRLNPEAGEMEKSWPTVLALSREVNGKTQKIMILGDADCLSNGEIGISRKNINAANYSLISGAFYWMSDEEVPIDVRRPPMPDNRTCINNDKLLYTKIFFTGVFPAILAVAFLILWLRRRGR